jgi:hypothetical protein
VDHKMFIVIVRLDQDCDGYSEGYHRVEVDVNDWVSVRNGDFDSHPESEYHLIAKCMQDESAGFSGDASACYIISEAEFFSKVWSRMDSWERDYWFSANYHGGDRGFSVFR